MNESLINDIIKAIRMSNIDAENIEITPDTKFEDIPGLDSVTMINFQIDLLSLIGAEKAQNVQPIPEMTIAQLAEVIDSL